MPVTFLDRIPLPNLKIYSALSVILLSVSVYHAVNVTSDPEWKTNVTQAEGGKSQSDLSILLQSSSLHLSSNDSRTLGCQFADVASFMIQEPFCIWTLINMSYCVLFLLGRSIQRIVFGELRVSERQHVKDKFWNFVFYKFIFVFGVINVQYMDEVVMWVAWFTALGFLHLLTQLCKDRLEYLSFSSSSGGWAGARLAGLLGVILLSDGLLMVLCVAVAFLGGGLNTFAFMAAECGLLSICTFNVIIRYALLASSGPGAPPSGGSRAAMAHYCDLYLQLVAVLLDLAHHVHMLLWANIFLSMASLVICMQLRFLFHELQRRVRKHRNYLMVLKHIERVYPMATVEELTENSDNCAICWEKMEAARKLPCGHVFHNWCLSSWLQQDTSCPTCRLVLSLWPTRSTQPPSQPRQPNHFFHFDGSRYVSWLPSFSVEVTHIMRPEPQANNSQMDAMARQVQQLFPNYPLNVILRDLLHTHSVELTVENILDGRLTLPPRLLSLDAGGALLLTAPPTPGSQVLLQHSLSMLANRLSQNHAQQNQGQTQQSQPQTQQSHTQQNQSQNQKNHQPIHTQPGHQNSGGEACNSEKVHSESNDDHPSIGGRFSKCSSERERILQTRKEQLINSARKKYLDKQTNKHKPNNLNIPSTSTHTLTTKPNSESQGSLNN